MLTGKRTILVFLVALLVSVEAAAAQPSVTRYAVVDRMPGPSAVVAWDYATVDARTQRLFLATYLSGASGNLRGEILEFDLKSKRLLPVRIKDAMPHQVVILGDGMGAAADGARHAVLFFEERSGTVLSSVRTGKPLRRDPFARNPDSLLFDASAHLLIAVNHDAGELVLISVARRAVVGVVNIGGALEAVASAPQGAIFVNVANKAEIAVVDLHKRKVVERIRMGGCEEPTGIAYDAARRLIVSVCSNGFAKFIDAYSGSVVASIPVGKGADGVMFDRRRQLVFIAGGDSGTLSVIHIGKRHHVVLSQTLTVPVGTRLGVLDPTNGQLYLPVARFKDNIPPLKRSGAPPVPRPKSGSFGLLVVASRP